MARIFTAYFCKCIFDKKSKNSKSGFLRADYLDEDLNIPFPKLKDVEVATNLKPHILRKLLLKMHNEIFTYERKLKLSFTKVLYHFYIRYFEYGCEFTVDHLTHMPRIGDSISLPFVSAAIPINFSLKMIQSINWKETNK